ncbi:MAG: hypothetical protein VW874_12745 [Gammaproteobacteria bacterium]|jgi:hypothetical protein
MEIIIDTIGWFGMIVLIAAYLLVSNKKVDSQSKAYQGMNVVASFCLIINTGYYGAYPATALNVVWVLMGLFFLARILTGKVDSNETAA